MARTPKGPDYKPTTPEEWDAVVAGTVIDMIMRNRDNPDNYRTMLAGLDALDSLLYNSKAQSYLVHADSWVPMVQASERIRAAIEDEGRVKPVMDRILAAVEELEEKD